MQEIPKAFLSRMQTLLGEAYPAFLREMENAPVRALRGNPLKCTAFSAPTDIETEPLPFSGGGYIFYSDSIGRHPLHHAGAFYVQDPSAISTVAAVTSLLRPGMRILDLCAAPGGKCTQLAGALHETGMLVANEISRERCRILRQNIERMGVRNAVVTSLDSEKILAYYPSFFDFVLVDAPCSGEGMFRKYPEAVEEWSEDNVVMCARRQKKILADAAGTVVGGGYLLYSTCTFSLEENEQVIHWFLETHPEFTLRPVSADVAAVTANGISVGGQDLSAARRFYPHLISGEGQFLCLLQKEDGLRGETQFQNALRPLTKEEEKAARVFFTDALGYIPQRLSGLRDNVVWIPDGMDGCPPGAFCCGVPVGNVTKGRLIPHHHLFSAYGGKFLRKVDLPAASPQCGAYLRGEGFLWDDGVDNGWCAVHIDGIPCGGGKIVDGYVKNHYPKGLRIK
ncbi:MAG: hypothetical protein HFE66_05715 [Clostridiales bacterium]|jgi:NOL1/NOP2/sun family putative RNA methylase|nr:hypothetical protein [Clostridiales bacterium]